MRTDPTINRAANRIVKFIEPESGFWTSDVEQAVKNSASLCLSLGLSEIDTRAILSNVWYACKAEYGE